MIIQQKDWTLDSAREEMKILTEEILEADETFHLKFEFSGDLQNKIVGFYSSSYKDDNGNDRLVYISKIINLPCKQLKVKNQLLESKMVKNYKILSIERRSLKNNCLKRDQNLK